MSLARLELRAILEKLEPQNRLEFVLNRFYEKAAQDILIGFFFDGKDTTEIARKQRAFLLKATGIVQHYAGKPPGTAHIALPPILTGHFDRRLRLLEETLREEGLSPLEVHAWVAFEEMFRAILVR